MKKIKHTSFVLTMRMTTMIMLLIPANIVFFVGFAPLTTSPLAYATSSNCINLSDRTIEVSCDTTFAQLAKNVNDDSLLKILGNGEYLLSADLHINEDASLLIAAPEVTWIKISNKGSPQYNILVDGGQMDIKGVKITSWDPEKSAVVDQNSKGSVPRPYINYKDAKGGIIQTSELAYMGYDGNEKRGFSLAGDTSNIEIRDSDFHHWWYAFYSNGAENVTIDNNQFHDNYKYAIDPHTGTHDMKITNNHVYNNPGSGIICSIDCYDILIENNTIHDNGKTGINLSRNMHDSIVRNNTIYNSPREISISDSPNNEIYDNTIYDVAEGFHYVDGHTPKNKIHDNTIHEDEKYDDDDD